MHNCNAEIGVMCGMDFMLNYEDGKWYYLENQTPPAIDEWARTKNIVIPISPNLKNYIKVNEIELHTSEEALMSTTKYYQEKTNNGDAPLK